MLRGLATVNLGELGIDTGAVLSTLGSIGRELTAKLAAIDESGEVLKKATVRVLQDCASKKKGGSVMARAGSAGKRKGP